MFNSSVQYRFCPRSYHFVYLSSKSLKVPSFIYLEVEFQKKIESTYYKYLPLPTYLSKSNKYAEDPFAPLYVVQFLKMQRNLINGLKLKSR